MPATRPQALALLSVASAILAALAWLWWISIYRADIAFLPHIAPAEWVLYPRPLDDSIRTTFELGTVFRRSFNLDSPPPHSSFRVAGFRRFNLAVNGTPLETPVQSGNNWKQPVQFDLSNLLRKGSNDIVVTVWNSNGPPALWLALDAGHFKLTTGPGWDCSFADATWRPARLASEPPAPVKGGPLCGCVEPLTSLKSKWPILLAFACLTAGLCWLLLSPTPARLVARVRGPLRSKSVEFGVLIAVSALWVALFANNLRGLPVSIGYDVVHHLNYISYIQERHALPFANEGLEMFQPPLYYLLSAALLNVFHLPARAEAASLVLRLLGLVIAIAHLVVVWASLRLLFPGERAKQYWGLLFAGLFPPLLYISQYVTNEGLAAALMSACVFMGLRALRAESISWKACAGLGVCLGAALLTKSSALLLIPALAAGLAWKVFLKMNQLSSTSPLSGSERAVVRATPLNREFLRCAGQLGLIAVLCALVCGWHYFRVWRHFGTPLVNSWEPRAGLNWWQDHGYRTSSFFLRFGHVLRYPWLGGFTSFADGFYSTLWGDGFSGFERLSERCPWNYEQMALGYWLALPLTFALLAGGVLAVISFIRNPRPEWAMLLCLSFLSMLALLFYSLNAPFQCVVKAFYVMGALVPFCSLGALGLEAFAGRNLARRAACCLLFGIWAINTYVSFWTLPHSTTVPLLRARFAPPATAIRELEPLLKRCPANSEARAMLLSSLIAGGENQQAATQLDILAQENPSDAEAQLTMAWAYAHQNRSVEAIEHARYALAIGPGYVPVYKHLAWLLLQNERYGEAAEVARNGLALTPLSPELRFALGTALRVNGDNTNAAIQLGRAFSLNPNWPEARDLLGTVLLRHGWLREARNQFSEALRSNTNDTRALFTLGQLSLALGQPQKAEDFLSRAVRFQPNQPELHYLLGLAFKAEKRPTDAAAEFTEALRLKPGFPLALNELAWLRAANPDERLRNGPEAVRLAESACQLTDYKQPVLLRTLSVAYAEAGRFEQALSTINKARALPQPQQRNQEAQEYQNLIDLFTAQRAYHEPMRK
jgi:Flp pilus assembly protein TadD